MEVPSKSIIERVNVNYNKDSNLYLLSGIDKLSLNTCFERLGRHLLMMVEEYALHIVQGDDNDGLFSLCLKHL